MERVLNLDSFYTNYRRAQKSFAHGAAKYHTAITNFIYSAYPDTSMHLLKLLY